MISKTPLYDGPVFPNRKDAERDYEDRKRSSKASSDCVSAISTCDTDICIIASCTIGGTIIGTALKPGIGTLVGAGIGFGVGVTIVVARQSK